jgi:astacin (peptidase family M12A)
VNQQIHLCIDKVKNADIYEKRSGPPRPIAVDTRFMWPDTGKTLKVKFLEGDPSLISKVKEKFNLWLPHATRIKFDYVTDGNADVRIRFDHQDGGSWSYIGQEILDFPQDQHTMNFGWLDTSTPDAEIERVAVHEMGHTLGFIHEQSQPSANIDWDEEAVYAFFAQQGWDRDQTYHNVMERYSKQITQFTEYDPISIMHYWFPAQLLKSRREIPGGNKLSDKDKAFAKQLYGQA